MSTVIPELAPPSRRHVCPSGSIGHPPDSPPLGGVATTRCKAHTPPSDATGPPAVSDRRRANQGGTALSSRRITIFDTTLRDGEQAPGIALRPDEKVEIGEQLERLGVDVIEAGFAASSPGDFEGVRAVARPPRTSPSPRSAAPAPPTSTPRAAALADAPRSRIHIFLATSALHMEKKLRLTPDEVVAARDVLGHAGLRERGRGRVLLRGRDALRPRVRRHRLPAAVEAGRDDDQPPGHRRLLHAVRVRGVHPRRPPSCAPSSTTSSSRPLPRRPRPRGRQLARGARRRRARSSRARSTASASAPATRRSRRS